MKDLTKGKPSTLILAFALPIFFANLLQLTYSLVDTRIVGTFLGRGCAGGCRRDLNLKQSDHWIFARDFPEVLQSSQHRNSVQKTIKM